MAFCSFLIESNLPLRSVILDVFQNDPVPKNGVIGSFPIPSHCGVQVLHGDHSSADSENIVVEEDGFVIRVFNRLKSGNGGENLRTVPDFGGGKKTFGYVSAGRIRDYFLSAALHLVFQGNSDL